MYSESVSINLSVRAAKYSQLFTFETVCGIIKIARQVIYSYLAICDRYSIMNM